MNNATPRALNSGSTALDPLLATTGGLITLRSPRIHWLSQLALSLLVHNHSPHKKTLYLHWADYHQRAWTIDIDAIVQLAKRARVPPHDIEENTLVLRYFTQDNVDAQENWQQLERTLPPLNLAILDSVSELREEATGTQRNNPKPALYGIAQFTRLCTRCDCIGIALDYSHRPVHPFLAEHSSILIEFTGTHPTLAHLLKHPTLAPKNIPLPHEGQQKLPAWITASTQRT